MALCFLCKKNLGFLERKYRIRYGGEEVTICNKCAGKSWFKENNRLIIQALYECGDPKPDFIIHNIERIVFFDTKIREVGTLVFADKGIYYITHPVPEEDIANLEAALKTYGVGERFNALHDKSLIQYPKTSQELKTAVENSPWLLFFPKNKITTIEYTSHNGVPGLWIKDLSMGKGALGTQFDMERDEFITRWKPLINEYMTKRAHLCQNQE